MQGKPQGPERATHSAPARLSAHLPVDELPSATEGLHFHPAFPQHARAHEGDAGGRRVQWIVEGL
eukprot:6673177-Pyramimonas_sp.AAC.1